MSYRNPEESESSEEGRRTMPVGMECVELATPDPRTASQPSKLWTSEEIRRAKEIYGALEPIPDTTRCAFIAVALGRGMKGGFHPAGDLLAAVGLTRWAEGGTGYDAGKHYLEEVEANLFRVRSRSVRSRTTTDAEDRTDAEWAHMGQDEFNTPEDE